jgi:hypothetical protein
MHLPRPPAVGLTDRQLDAVLDHAHDIAPEFRSEFLHDVIHALMPLEVVNDNTVIKACCSVAIRIRQSKRQAKQAKQRASA